MPILGPSGLPIFLISDLESEVLKRLENRTSDTARADVWLRDAILEIAGNTDFRNEFDQLEIYGTPFSLTAQLQEYPFSSIVPPGSYNIATLDIMLFTDYPTNVNRIRLDEENYQAADRISSGVYGLPQRWYRYADNLGFILSPDKPYLIQSRIYQQHPINDAALSTTQILLPRDWNEILIWAAVEKGF